MTRCRSLRPCSPTEPRTMDLFATLLELLGVVLIVLAAWLVTPPLGIAVTGAALVTVGYLLERD